MGSRKESFNSGLPVSVKKTQHRTIPIINLFMSKLSFSSLLGARLDMTLYLEQTMFILTILLSVYASS